MMSIPLHSWVTMQVFGGKGETVITHTVQIFMVMGSGTCRLHYGLQHQHYIFIEQEK